MSEHLICNICDASCHFSYKFHGVRDCFWCGHIYTWSDRLKGLKDRTGMTNNQIANECRINPRTFEGLISGRFEPSKKNQEKIERVFEKYFS